MTCREIKFVTIYMFLGVKFSAMDRNSNKFSAAGYRFKKLATNRADWISLEQIGCCLSRLVIDRIDWLMIMISLLSSTTNIGLILFCHKNV